MFQSLYDIFFSNILHNIVHFSSSTPSLGMQAMWCEIIIIIKHGVPHGSILGPLFFLLYVNDLPEVITNNAKIILYADDTSVIIPNPSLQDLAINMNK
jgi:hypothetical protein